jgi:hypothetical protein
MYAKRLLTMAMAAMVLIGGVAAVGAAAPANAANDEADADDGNAEPGPDGGLPDVVPDHVSKIHDAIASFIDGGIDHLGSALSDLLGPSDAGQDGDAGGADASNKY